MNARHVLISTTILGALLSGPALAADAYLRLRCDGDAAGVTIRINGTAKGECPLDLALPEGKIRISARKDISQHSYKVYEKEILLAGGAMKRETIMLGPLQLTEEGKRLENERVAKEQAAAKAQAAAIAEQQRLKAEEDAKYGMVAEYFDMLSTEGNFKNENPIIQSLFTTISPFLLPLFTLSDLASGKQLVRVAADPAAFANPDSMMAKVQRRLEAEAAASDI